MNPITFYKALSDETRLQSIMLLCHQQELCVCELMVALDLSQPKISRHLAQLKQAGLVTDRRQGQWIFYRLNSQLKDWALTAINQTLSQNTDYVEKSLSRLNGMGSRPSRNQACCA